MNQTAQALAPFEAHLRTFLAVRGTDPDAMSAMFLLFRANTDTIAAMEAASLRPLGLTHAGFVLLMSLWTMGPQETRQLARIQRVSRPSIVSSVDTMERAGLVRRVRSAVDRRLVSVELTQEGAQMVERAQRAWHLCEQQIARVLTPAEQLALANILRKLDAAALAGCEVMAAEAKAAG
jgi:DNA-binding MarR family transcriptional regulator